MPHRALIALVLAVLLCVGAPVLAAAQSPGDEQYQDPFGSGGGGEPAQEPEPTAEPAPAADPAPAPAATAEPSAGDPAQPSATPPAGSAGGELPRTGASAALPALAGIALLAGGLALRRRSGGDRA